MRIFLLLSFLIIAPLAQANELAPYLSIYSDSKTANELTKADTDLIYERMQSQYYESIKDYLNPVQKRQVIEQLVIEELNITGGPAKARNDLLPKYEFEKKALTLEKKWLAELNQIVATTDENTENAPFDLIADLNLIDVILFGSKAAKTNPGFALPANGLSQAQTEWAVGDPRRLGEDAGTTQNLANPPEIYPETEKSVTAAIEAIMTYLKHLNSKPLNPEIAGKKVFDPGQAISRVATAVKSIHRTLRTPYAFWDAPEMVQVVDRNWAGLMGPILTRFTITEDKDYVSSLYTQQAGFSAADLQKEIIHFLADRQTYGIRRSGQNYDQAQQNYVYDRVLEHLGGHLAALEVQALEIEKSFTDIEAKPEK